VPDSFCKADPFSHWAFKVSAGFVTARLKRAGVRVGNVTRIKIAKRSPSGRAEIFTVYGSRKHADVNGNKFRIALGPERLRSTLITDLSGVRGGFRFEGRGWGHGIGLCQWGARGRALAGHKYATIIEAYYPESQLVRVSAE
jgi:stage II sporulation protein D